MLVNNFYDEVERPGFLKHILYGDTDSIFVVVPAKDADKMTAEQQMKIADDASEGINRAVSKYLNDYFLPKSNISVDKNATYFKSEMLMSAIMFLDVKKNLHFQ
jgi:DNA polymerase elongation subunit (family B)